MANERIGPTSFEQFKNWDRENRLNNKENCVVRCLVIYNTRTENRFFWERKRDAKELHLEHNIDLNETIYGNAQHAEYYVDKILREKIRDNTVNGTVTIYINMNPCKRAKYPYTPCEVILKNLANDYRKINFQISSLDHRNEIKTNPTILTENMIIRKFDDIVTVEKYIRNTDNNNNISKNIITTNTNQAAGSRNVASGAAREDGGIEDLGNKFARLQNTKQG